MTLYRTNALAPLEQMSLIVASPMWFCDDHIQVYKLSNRRGAAEDAVKLDVGCPIRQRRQLLECPETIVGLAEHVVTEKKCTLYTPEMATKFDLVAERNSLSVRTEHLPEIGPEMPYTSAFLRSVGPNRHYTVDAPADLTVLIVANALFGVWRSWSRNIVTALGSDEQDVLDDLE